MTNSSNPLSLREAYRVLRRQWLAEASDEEIDLLVGCLEEGAANEAHSWLQDIRLRGDQSLSHS